MIMNAVGVIYRETVVSIRKFTFTKRIDLRATKLEIDRFFMHADGSEVFQGHFLGA